MIKLATRNASRYLYLFYLPAALGLATLSRPILVIFAGEKYECGAPLLAIFGLFGALTTLIPMLGYLLITYGRTKTYMATNLASVFGSLLLAPLLISSFGVLMGVAVMKGVASIILLLAYLLSLRGSLAIDWRAVAKASLASLVMASVVFALQLYLIPAYFLLVHVAVGALIYGACVRALRMLSRRDARLLTSIVPGALKKPVLSIILLLVHEASGGEQAE